MSEMKVKRIHHVAYRCKDALETVKWYEKYMGMTYQLAFAENKVPSTQEPDPYMHVFLDCGNGNGLAFFELPTKPEMGRDENTPPWVQHIAFEVESMDELLAAKARLEADGIEVIGPVDHTLFESIYFFEPNGHRMELSVNTPIDGVMDRLDEVKWPMLEEWAKTKRAPDHARWMHDGSLKKG